MNSSTSLPLRSGGLPAALRKSFLSLEQPWFAAFFAGLFYLFIAMTVGVPWRVSHSPYYNLLADAFLHGQLHLRILPEITRDISLFEGNYYLYWGPLPALLAMPLVALFGPYVSDVMQTLVVGSLNAGLFALLLRHVDRSGFIPLTPGQRAWLVLFFALGTPVTPLPAVGRVWELNSLLSVTCALGAYLAVFSYKGRKAFVLAGLGVAGIMLTRISGIFSAVFLAAYLLKTHWPEGRRSLIVNSLAGLAPVMVTLALIGLYNFLRFGHALDNGFGYQLWGDHFYNLYQQYGAFHPVFIAPNFYVNYIQYPFSFQPFNVSGWGGSLFLLSPLFFAMFSALWQGRKQLYVWALFVSVLLGSIMLLLLFGPGTFQFGLRYALDFILPMILLTAAGMRRWPGWLTAAAVILSVLHFLVGSIMFAHAVSRAVVQ